MGSRLPAFGPSVERVIHNEAVPQKLVVIGRDIPQAHRDRQQSCGLRRKVMPIGVGAPNDRGESNDRRIVVEGVFGHEGIEAAAVSHMGKFDIRDIVGRRTGFLGNGQHPVPRHEQELGFLVDEPRDEPGASNAVDDRSFASDPFHGFVPPMQFGATVGAVEALLPARSPLTNATFKRQMIQVLQFECMIDMVRS